MFTGIVQSIGTVLSIDTNNNLSRIVIQIEREFSHNITLGASIAINGTCLTVVRDIKASTEYSEIHFDVIDETLKVTNLSTLVAGSKVNFERSLKVGDEIGGHQVSGHIHKQAFLSGVKQSPENICLTFTLANDESSNWQRFMFEKGFICINGASLTLGEVSKSQFNVHLIPETLQRTNLSLLNIDDYVNIEFDQQTITIVQTIERMNLKMI